MIAEDQTLYRNNAFTNAVWKTDFGEIDFGKTDLGKADFSKTDFGKTNLAKPDFGKNRC